MNIQIIKLAYKYQNYKINSDELLKELGNLNNPKLDSLIQKITYIKQKNPNTVDKFEKERLNILDFLNNSCQQALEVETNELIRRQIQQIYDDVKEENIMLDNRKIYKKINRELQQLDILLNYQAKFSDLELLNFITAYTKVSHPPKISKQRLNNLVKLCIQTKDDKKLYRLAFNYSTSKIDCDLIVDYYIKEKQAFYLTEIMYIFADKLNFLKIVNKVLRTQDTKFIDEVYKQADLKLLLNNNLLEKLKKRY